MTTKPLRQIILRDRGLADLAQCLNSVERDLCKPDCCSCVCFFLSSYRLSQEEISWWVWVKDSKKKLMQQEDGEKERRNKRKRVEESQ